MLEDDVNFSEYDKHIVMVIDTATYRARVIFRYVWHCVQIRVLRRIGNLTPF